MATHTSNAGVLFEGVNFIADNIDSKSVQLLVNGGASQFQSLEEAPKQASLHLFTLDFSSQVSLAAQKLPYKHRTSICKPEWIKVSQLKGRLQDVRRYSPDPRQFLTGVCVTCSGLPDGDKEAIYGGVLALGGQYSDQLVKGTTHIVTLTLDSDKVREALDRAREGIEIVLPHWFDDCLRLRRRVPSDPYRFPQPKILQSNLAVGVPQPISPDSDFRYLSDANLQSPEMPDAQEDIFNGKKFFIGLDLNLGPRLLETISAVLGSANGILAKNLTTADVYIGKWRAGRDYLLASRSHKIVGNYTWILYCIAHGKYSSPMSHLLHYPLPQGGLHDFKNDVITVSNYTGEARSYLERLVIALGAKFTRNMKPENTHLITALETGEKYSTAKQWGINCVNHLWLEESFAQWQKLPVTEASFTTFPRETNLMDVIAQTPIAPEGIELFYAEDDTEDEDENTNTNNDKVERVQEPITQDESQDVELPDIKDVRQFSSPLPVTRKTSVLAVQSDKRANGSSLASTPQVPPELTETSIVTSKDTPEANKQLAGTTSRVAVESSNLPPPQTPSRLLPQTPSSRGSTARKASQAAASRLRENMEDANKFGQQMRNKHKLPPLPSELQPANKRVKSTSIPRSPEDALKIVLTGCPDLTEKLQTQGQALGIEFIDDPAQATHIISPRIARTKKFVVAIPFSPFFVNWNWLLDSIKNKAIQPEDDYPLDPAPQAAWSKNLHFPDVLTRARECRNRDGLLHDFVILVTDAVTKVGGFETYRDIVEANGGICGLLGRRGTDLTKGRLVIISDGATDPAVAKFLHSHLKASKRGKENKVDKGLSNAEVYDREWLMICAIRQELVFDPKFKYTD